MTMSNTPRKSLKFTEETFIQPKQVTTGGGANTEIMDFIFNFNKPSKSRDTDQNTNV